MTQFTNQFTGRLKLLSIFLLIPFLSYGQNLTANTPKTPVDSLPRMVSNCVESYFLNIAHTLRIATLNEKLNDCRTADSASQFALSECKGIIAIKNAEIDIHKSDKKQLESELAKEKRNRFWRKIAVPSLGLNAALLLILL